MIQKLKHWFFTPTGWFALYVILFVGGLVTLCGLFYIADSKNLDPLVLERLDIKEDEFNEYMAKTFMEGTPRDDVYEALENFGNYKTTPFDLGYEGQECELIEIPMQKTLFGTEPSLTYLACFSLTDNTLVRWALNS